ncbi:MAG TPA: HD domain-containing phosphohydrolase [Blastocatellia bacterium]|nr:HD domain-containing phosphohydrolase [Blastocatellia bacterium]
MVKPASLTLQDDKGEARDLDVESVPFRIGRLGANDLKLDNPYISRHHVEITLEGTTYLVRDLGSTSGTFVNGRQVKRSKLKDGDRIRLGRAHGVEFVFHNDRDCEADETMSDDEDGLQPVRIIQPQDARFLNTAKLPDSGALSDQTVNTLRSLYEFMGDLLTVHSANELTSKVVSFLQQSLRADRCAVLLFDDDKGCLEVAAASGDAFTPSSSVTSRVFDDNVAVLSLDASADERFKAGDSIRFQSIHSVMCAPIGSKTRAWGVCYVDNTTPERAFHDETLDFLAAVAHHAGLALENIYLLEEQRRSLESFIRTLAASLDARDDNTAGHSARVGAISMGIARRMGLSPNDCRLIYYAGLLHDYGKIGVRDDVLLKPAQLTAEEYAHVKEHPMHTFRLLSKMRFPEDLAEIPFVAAAHHERWDGTGYPHGLSGEEIPLGSRIVAVADAYDALTEDRCYHEGWEPARAVVELTRRSGTYFDPTVITAFTEYFEREMMPRIDDLAARRQEVKTLIEVPVESR